MGNETILKKSLFGGFKKSDVINYIEALQLENCDLKEELNSKNEEISQIANSKEAYDELKSDYDALLDEYNSLKSKYDLLSQKETYRPQPKEDMSSAVVKDAMKYADSIVSAAKESAAGVIAQAAASIAGASAEIIEANVKVKNAQANLDNSLDCVQESVNSLLQRLSLQTNDLKEGQ